MENNYHSDTLLKPSDVARRLNISRSLVYQLIRTGDIPVVRIKSTVRIKSSDLSNFIEQRQSKDYLQTSLF